MTRKNLNRIIFAAIVAFCFLLGGVIMAFGATVWNQSAGTFSWYKYGTANKYLLSTDLSAPASWIKQSGVYIQCKSEGGATRYYAQGYDCYGKQVVVTPPTSVCNAKFVCHEQWGWIVDLTQLKADGCNHVKISNSDALFYDGMRNENGQLICKKWPQ